MMRDFFEAAEFFVGRQVTRVQTMTQREVDACFIGALGNPPPVLEFGQDSYLFPSRDDEGNGPGILSLSPGISSAEELVGKTVAELRLLRPDEISECFKGEQSRTTWAIMFTDGTFCYPSRNEHHLPQEMTDGLRAIMGQERFDHDVGAFFGATPHDPELTLPVTDLESGMKSQEEWEAEKARRQARDDNAKNAGEHVQSRPRPNKSSL